MGEMLRLFVAVWPSEEVRRAAVAAVTRCRDGNLRVVTEEALHLTLRFLGNQPEERVPDLLAALGRAAAASEPLLLELAGPLVLPGAARPRVLAVGVGGAGREALVALAGVVERGLAEVGVPGEDRAFTPHLTVGRVREPRHGRGLAEKWLRMEVEQAQWPVGAIALVQSHLKPDGPRYRTLAAIPLGQGAGAGDGEQSLS